MATFNNDNVDENHDYQKTSRLASLCLYMKQTKKTSNEKL